MANLGNSCNPVIQLENISHTSYHKTDNNCEKIGEIYRLSPEHLSFVCSQCGDQFPTLIQFTAHVQTHLQYTYQSLKHELTLHLADINDDDISSAIGHQPSGHDNQQLDSIIVEAVEIEPIAWDESEKTKDPVPNSLLSIERKCNKQRKKGRTRTAGREYECYLCRMRCVKKKQCVEHIRTTHMELEFTCQLCDEKFRKASGLRRHNSYCTEANAFKCADCHLTFYSRKWMINHRRKTHDAEQYNGVKRAIRTYECYICRKQSVDRKQCRKHSRTHLSLDHSCQYCGKKFLEISYLRRHSQFCTQSNAFRCVECSSLSFHSEERLHIHRRDIHGGHLYRCSICNLTFTDRQARAQHKHTSTQPKPFQCDECGNQFRNKNQLKSHQNVHSDVAAFKCDQCPKSFKQYSTWYIHRRKHSGAPPHECNECGKRYYERSMLKKHQRCVHGILKEESRVECTICQKILSCASGLQQHMRLHTGRKLIHCPVCDFKCPNQAGMKKHMLSHSNQRDFPCDLCPKAFKVKDALTAHRRIHLNDYRFVCQWCGRGFHDNRIHKRHLLTEHGQVGDDEMN